MKYQKLFFVGAVILLMNLVVFAGNDKMRVSQTEIVKFPQNGELQVSAVEIIDKHLILRFSNSRTKKIIASFQIKADDDRYIPFHFSSTSSPFLRFRVLNIEGLPSPLIHAVALNPGGSDHAFMSVLIGEINGKLKILTPAPIETSIQGGVHIGALGENRGAGIAVWNFIWDKNEVHHAAHRYEFTFYRFDEKTGNFIKGETISSKQKHDTYEGALDEMKLSSFRNAQNVIPEVRRYREDDEN